MRFASVREARNQLSHYLSAAKREDVVITRSGKPVALLSALSEEEFEDRLLESNPKFRRVIERRWANYLKSATRPPARR